MVTLFHLAIVVVISIVALGFLKAFRQTRSIARAAQDPEQLAQCIRAAVEAAGGDAADVRVEVKVSGVPRQPFAQPLLPDRPSAIDAHADTQPPQRGPWLLALTAAAAVAWAVVELI